MLHQLLALNPGDKIQLAICVILAGTGIAIYRQLRTQSKLAKAQLLRDRFEMYARTYEPVTDEQVKELKLYPADYMEPAVYQQKYQADDQAIRKYIYMTVLYEYLAFTHQMPPIELVATNFLGMWVNDLLAEPVFHDVHKCCGKYYPDFGKFVDAHRAH